jgi:NHLM bacteriocin system ABC transporter ATP-binding protein
VTPFPHPEDDRPIELSASRPRTLAAGEIWRVETGTVDLFAVTPEEHGAAPEDEEGTGDEPSRQPVSGGARTHLATFETGDLVLGARSGAEGRTGHDLTLVAVGRPGCRIRPVDPAELDRAASSPEGSDPARDLDRWITALGLGVPRPPEPRHPREVSAGEEAVVDKAGPVRTTGEVLWVEVAEGRFTYLGIPELPLPSPEISPLPPRLWVASDGPGRLVARSTREILRTRPATELALPALESFHQVILRRLRSVLDERNREERRRVDQRVELDRSTLRAAYTRLLSVLAPETEAEVSADELRDPLLAACRRVGDHLGVEIRKPRISERRKQGDRLVAIADASRIRTRRVILRSSWWERDNGSLVAFREIGEGDEKTRHPVALIPTSPRSYELVDPVIGERRAVDEELADELTGDAHMFYAPLPERALRLRDLAAAALWGSRADVLTIVLMGLGGGLLGLLLPVLTGYIFGRVIPNADRSRLLQMSLALAVAALAGGAFQITRSIAVLRLSGRMEGGVQAAVWDRLLALPVTFFRRFTVGDLTTRAMGVESIREVITGNVLTSILAAVFSIFSFALLFYYSARLALVSTALVMLLMGITALLTWLQVRHQRQFHRLRGRLASLLFGLIHGVAKLKVGGAEQRAFGLWAERFAEQRQASIRARRVAVAQGAFNASYAVVTTLVVFAVMGLAMELELSVGDFLAFNAAFGQFTSAALSMVGVFSSLLAIVPIYERLTPILEAVPEVDDSKVDAGELSGDVEFSHVYFRYQDDGPLILEDVSLRARPGEFIALVGPSGSGKSTCLRLILGFEEPESGSIYFDGQDLGSLSLQSVRRQIGVVLQTGKPMVGDILSNITGSSNLGLDAAWEAAEMAGLADDIRAMPMGMHTVISEGAGTFSGGQQQRLLIARALIHRPRILLFDEATSALDNRTQEVVSRSLDRLQATRIVIAHRLSTIQNADRIYVVEAGQVVESGPYAELMGGDGAFARLAERQLV